MAVNFIKILTSDSGFLGNIPLLLSPLLKIGHSLLVLILLPLLLLLLSVVLITANTLIFPISLAEANPQGNEVNRDSDFKPAVSARKREKIRRILQKALLAYNEERLTTPFDDNAYFHYLRVLALDPENPQAIHGLNDIVERYLDLAINHANLFEFKFASDFLAKARSVDDTHPNIQAVENKINQLKSARKNRVILPLTQVKSRSSDLSNRLRDIGRTIARQNASVIIKAPSDVHGRWIYQQLNDADEHRVRAEFRVGEQTEVMLLY